MHYLPLAWRDVSRLLLYSIPDRRVFAGVNTHLSAMLGRAQLQRDTARLGRRRAPGKLQVTILPCRRLFDDLEIPVRQTVAEWRLERRIGRRRPRQRQAAASGIGALELKFRSVVIRDQSSFQIVALVEENSHGAAGDPVGMRRP